MDQMTFTDTMLDGQPGRQYKHYIVLKDGRVWLENKRRFSKISTSSTGYQQIFFDGASHMLAHVVVKAWHGVKPARVGYKDFNVKNNALENLIWR